MDGVRLAVGIGLLVLAAGVLVPTQRGVRRSHRAVQQAALVAPLVVGLAALVAGTGLFLTGLTPR